MTTRKGKINIMSFISILTIAAWLIMSSAQVGAETVSEKFRVTGYIVRVEAIPVEDVEGHVLMVIMRRGLASFETGETAKWEAWVTGDFIKGKGPFQGYTKYTYEDGSTTIAKVEGFWEAIPDGKSLYKGTSEYIKGTGRFEGIKGSMSYTGKGLTPYSKEKGLMSDVYYDCIATYSLPRK
ncbi:MAG: hypothetical protein AB1502_08470 [Thermodesulfobacteriota bacterium]